MKAVLSIISLLLITNCAIYSNDETIEDTLNENQKNALSNLFKANGLNVTKFAPYALDSGTGMVKKLSFPSIIKLDTLIITEDIKELTELEILIISNHNLSNLPTELTFLTKLRELVLSGNSFFDYPENLLKLTQLSYIDLSHNALNTIPKEISTFSELQYLVVNNNQIDSISPELKNLNKLKWLNLSNNNISSLPNSIIELNLQSLFIRSNKLCNVSDTLKNWLMLDSLWHQQSC